MVLPEQNARSSSAPSDTKALLSCYFDEDGCVEIKDDKLKVGYDEENEEDQQIFRRKASLSDTKLSKLKLDSPFHDADDGSMTGPHSLGSETDDDLNTLSSTSSGLSSTFELFPADSFSSLTGVKCDQVERSVMVMGCVDPLIMLDAPQNATTFRRGRSFASKPNRTNCSKRRTTDNGKPLDASEGLEVESQDSIIECRAETHNVSP
jgi:hypothetical protein